MVIVLLVSLFSFVEEEKKNNQERKQCTTNSIRPSNYHVQTLLHRTRKPRDSKLRDLPFNDYYRSIRNQRIILNAVLLLILTVCARSVFLAVSLSARLSICLSDRISCTTLECKSIVQHYSPESTDWALTNGEIRFSCISTLDAC